MSSSSESVSMQLDQERKPNMMASVTAQVVVNNSLQALNTPESNNSSLTTNVAAHEDFPDIFDDISEDLNPSIQKHFKKFPPGYRFRPTEEELVEFYLKQKVSNQPLPINRIVSVNLYRYNPEVLAERYKDYGETEWYFFTPRDRKYPNGNRPNRAAGDGFWKATGADKLVESEGNIVGFKKSLVFYKGKPPKGDKTNWIMHEFRVNSPPRSKKDANDMRLDEWVLCRIYKKTGKSTRACTRGEIDSTSVPDDEVLDDEENEVPWSFNDAFVDPETMLISGDYMQQPFQNGVPEAAQFYGNFYDQYPAVGGPPAHMIQPIGFGPPLAHSTENLFESELLNTTINLDNGSLDSQCLDFNNMHRDNLLQSNLSNDPYM